LAVDPAWKDVSVLFDLNGQNTPATFFGAALQNVHYGLGATASSTIDIDDFKIQQCTPDPVHHQTIASEHILHYNNPLATDENGDPIAYEPLSLEGCWSNVDGEIVTMPVELD